ncbi:DUF6326 family protein [Dactylosporangium sp. CA-233914]|uniref:DUF6326 family protein n=1 Tax=Dactylosporangium sp. CA-233914 TaxID=3239934 RepID=UPI003D8CB24A
MIYTDIVSYLDPELLRGIMSGYADGTRITQTLLVAAAVTGEIPILMVLLSRVLKPTVSRWANVAAMLVQVGAASVHPCRHSGGGTAPLERRTDDHPKENPEPARQPADPRAGQARRRMDQLHVPLHLRRLLPPLQAWRHRQHPGWRRL